MHLMIDLETLGTGDHAAIIQIAAVKFELYPANKEILDTFSRRISIEDPNLGAIDGPTVLWWLQQKPKTIEQVFDQTNTMALEVALWELADFVEKDRLIGVWSNGPNFDMRLLRQAWDRTIKTRRKWPFDFRKEFDYRTIRYVGKRAEAMHTERLDVEMAHNALADAIYQARQTVSVLRLIDGGRDAFRARLGLASQDKTTVADTLKID